MVYRNPSAEHVSLFPEALAAIGAGRVGDVIGEMTALFPGGKPATDWNTRNDQIQRLPKRTKALASELERLFDEWLPKTGGRVLVRQLYDYIHAEPVSAKKSPPGSRFPRRRGK
jgi:hypothetical protein